MGTEWQELRLEIPLHSVQPSCVHIKVRESTKALFTLHQDSQRERDEDHRSLKQLNLTIFSSKQDQGIGEFIAASWSVRSNLFIYLFV